jgi:hypothetical protein
MFLHFLIHSFKSDVKRDILQLLTLTFLIRTLHCFRA